MIFIVGGKGFIGSALVRHANKHNLEYEIIQKENKNNFFGKSCDTLIFANGNSLKYKANKNHFFDFNASVVSVVEYVHKIDFKQFVFLSTVDVYDKKNSELTTFEKYAINANSLETYGFHKLLAENYVKKYCKNYIIFRLGGLVGKNLKKNPVFDFINSEKNVMISGDSKLNFINTDFVANTIFKITNKKINNETFNLASKNSIRLGDIKNIVGFDSEFTPDSSQHIQNYKINTEKIQEYIDLSTSESAIKEYFNSLS